MNVFPFLIGCQRSGTTLLRAIFDSHPEIAVLHESEFLGQMACVKDAYEREGRFDVNRLLSDLGERLPFEAHKLSEATISTSFERNPPSDLADAMRQVFHQYAERNGKVRYADKTPSHVTKVSRLAKLFPEARFVHIIRDGRDVALSLLDMKWGPGTVGAAARYWRRRVEFGRTAGRRLPGRYREVKYEELVADPEGVVPSLCDFLDLRFDPKMLSYYERATDIAAVADDPHQHARLALPPTAGLRDWRHTMAQEDVALFEVVAGRVLRELGYEAVLDRIPQRIRVKARCRAAGLSVCRVPRRARRVRLRMLARLSSREGTRAGGPFDSRLRARPASGKSRRGALPAG